MLLDPVSNAGWRPGLAPRAEAHQGLGSLFYYVYVGGGGLESSSDQGAYARLSRVKYAETEDVGTMIGGSDLTCRAARRARAKR